MCVLFLVTDDSLCIGASNNRMATAEQPPPLLILTFPPYLFKPFGSTRASFIEALLHPISIYVVSFCRPSVLLRYSFSWTLFFIFSVWLNPFSNPFHPFTCSWFHPTSLIHAFITPTPPSCHHTPLSWFLYHALDCCTVFHLQDIIIYVVKGGRSTLFHEPLLHGHNSPVHSLCKCSYNTPFIILSLVSPSISTCLGNAVPNYLSHLLQSPPKTISPSPIGTRHALCYPCFPSPQERKDE